MSEPHPIQIATIGVGALMNRMADKICGHQQAPDGSRFYITECAAEEIARLVMMTLAEMGESGQLLGVDRGGPEEI